MLEKGFIIFFKKLYKYNMRALMIYDGDRKLYDPDL